jgi:hypothetical protein
MLLVRYRRKGTRLGCLSASGSKPGRRRRIGGPMISVRAGQLTYILRTLCPFPERHPVCCSWLRFGPATTSSCDRSSSYITVFANAPGLTEPVSTAAVHNIQRRNLVLTSAYPARWRSLAPTKTSQPHIGAISLSPILCVYAYKNASKTCHLAQGVINPPGSSGALITFSTSFAPDLGFK